MSTFDKDCLTWFVLLLAVLVLLADLVVDRCLGDAWTITATVRRWNEASVWPEVVFVASWGLLYLHLFRNFL